MARSEIRGFRAESEAKVEAPSPRQSRTAHIIVLGNEKGGTGKSTSAMHLLINLMKDGYTVASIDLDARQATLTNYIKNRQSYARRHGVKLAVPHHYAIAPSDHPRVPEARREDRERFEICLGTLGNEYDFIIVDSPGSDTYLSRLAHSYADTLITPLNDSFFDLDVLVRVDPDSLDITGLSPYSEMVWEQRKERARRDGGSIDWIVMRNRLSHLGSRNMQNMSEVLDKLGKRIGFRSAPGYGERVIFRELFLCGLTMLDLRLDSAEVSGNRSHTAARQEIRDLMLAIGLPGPQTQLAASSGGAT